MSRRLPFRIAHYAAAVSLAGLSATLPATAPLASAAPTRSGPTRDATAAASHTLTIKHQSSVGGLFSPSTLKIKHGDSVTVHNADNMFHTVTSYAVGSSGKPLFDLQSGAGSSLKLTIASKLAAGTYKFFCRRHSAMKGTLVVTGSSSGIRPIPVQFEQGLKLPPVLSGVTNKIKIEQADVQVMPSGPKTRMWTYNGTYPGPTIRRAAGHDTRVSFTNELPASDGSLSVHLHGDHHSSANDGQPTTRLIGPGRTRTYDYWLSAGHAGRSAFDFYHDHRMGYTGRNNWYGLQGMFLIDNKSDAKLRLPTGKYDVPLDIADRSFDANNQLIDPASIHQAPPNDATTGNRILVNGRYAPYLRVSTHRYRLRLLNGSNFSSFDFRLSGSKSFIQVGNGSGLFPKPVKRTHIALGPAQRADVIVSFDNDYGHNVMLETGSADAATAVMDFLVSKKSTDGSMVPSALVRPPAINAPKTVSHIWDLGFGNGGGSPTWTIDGRAFDPNRIDLVVPYGSTQTWQLRNSTDMTHYVHLHEELWHTLLRDGHRPPAWERGLEDTWRLDPGEIVRVAARFTEYTGVFMIHCHMLDHEDDGMMAQFAVEKPGAALPAGFYLAGSAADSAAQAHGATAGMSGMPGMHPDGGATTSHSTVAPAAVTPAPAWHKVLATFGGAYGIELAIAMVGCAAFACWQHGRRRHRLGAMTA